MVFEGIQRGHARLTEGDSLLTHWSFEKERTIEEAVTALGRDSTAEVTNTEEWRYASFVRNDSILADTTRRVERLTFRISPDGRVVDLDFSRKTSGFDMAYTENWLSRSWPVFPEGDVTLGHSWTQTTRVTTDGDLTDASCTYRLESFARERGYDCVTIAYTGDLTVRTGSGGTEPTARVNRVSLVGLMYFAYKEGIVVSVRDRYTLEGWRGESGELSSGDRSSGQLQQVSSRTHRRLDLEGESRLHFVGKKKAEPAH
jgi:hypothetical protein